MLEINEARIARERLRPYLRLPSELRPLQESIFFKMEYLHPTASFKVRPALNGILSHLQAARAQGVLTSSSGNFAQAVAWAGRILGCSAQVVMTSNTSSYKIARTRELGAQVTLCGPTFEERWETTRRLHGESGKLLLHPYDSMETILGNATIGLELLEQLDGPFTVLVPVSGGGLLAGIAWAIKMLRPACHVIGVQQSGNGSFKYSLDRGERVKVAPFVSCVDALVALTPGELTFKIAQAYVNDVLLVEEQAIGEAIQTLHAQNFLVEPAGAAGFAAVLSGRLQKNHPNPVVCLGSGGNVSNPKK